MSDQTGIESPKHHLRCCACSFSLVAALASSLVSVTICAAGDAYLDRLRCDYRANPLGIDAAQPELSWALHSASGARGEKQKAYQVLVASDEDLLRQDRGDLWDTGRIESEESTHVAYGGQTLHSHQRVVWKVRVWNQGGQPTPWSVPGTWTMGILQEPEWKARWVAHDIGASTNASSEPLPLLRREFDIAKPLRRALVHICGLGHYELRLNGAKVGDQELDPGWTNYRRRCLYSTYDVTTHLQEGRNAIGVMLGRGMYDVAGGRYTKFKGSFGPPKLILQLHLEFADGTADDIGTDSQWSTLPGPITFSCTYGGEDYDARREVAGWDRPGLNDPRWRPAILVQGPGGRLLAQSAPAVRAMQSFEPVKVTEPRPGISVYDLGQNFSGWPVVKARGPAGASVKLTPGELLDEHGLVSQGSSGKPVWFSYTLRGQNLEEWHPRFSYYGFRYVQAETANPSPSSKLVIESIAGQFVRSSASRVGQFECSNPLINRIHHLIDRAIESNLQSVLTDCPHREKLGWLEVSHLLGPAIMLNYDVPALYRKICADMADAQLPEGLVPDIAPEYTVFGGGFRDSPEWGSASVINPWHLYQFYGDRHSMAEHFGVMQRYVAYLGSKASNHIVSHGLGDWYDVGPGSPGESQLTSRGVTATAIYYQDIELLRRMAALLGKSDEAASYSRLAQQVRGAFNKEFFPPGATHYDRGSQTAQAMPLVLGLVEDAQRPAVLESLVRNIRSSGSRVTAGDVGFAYVVRALSTGRQGGVLYDMVVQTNGPGYADQLAKGATALTEAWNADPRSSHNHCMLGHAEEWFFSGLGGINPDPIAPGFKRVIIRPDVVGDVKWCKASHDSAYGEVQCRWEIQGNELAVHVTVPPNTSAAVHIPGDQPQSIREGASEASKAPGVQFLRIENGAALFSVASGRYHFRAPAPTR